MANKKKYNALDDIGFVGVKDRRTKSQIKRDMKATFQIVEERKSRKKTDKVAPKKNKGVKTTSQKNFHWCRVRSLPTN